MPRIGYIILIAFAQVIHSYYAEGKAPKLTKEKSVAIPGSTLPKPQIMNCQFNYSLDTHAPGLPTSPVRQLANVFPLPKLPSSLTGSKVARVVFTGFVGLHAPKGDNANAFQPYELVESWITGLALTTHDRCQGKHRCSATASTQWHTFRPDSNKITVKVSLSAKMKHKDHPNPIVMDNLCSEEITVEVPFLKKVAPATRG